MRINTRQNRLGDISATYVAVMARTLEERGIPSAPWLARFRISRGLLATPGARISIPRFMRMGHAAIGLSEDPALGLAFGENTRLTDMGFAGMAAISAPTLGAALRTLIRFERLTSYNSRGHSSCARDDEGRTQATFYSISPYNRYNCFVVDSILAGWVQFLRQLSGEQLTPQEVHIEYALPDYEEALQQWFQCDVFFSSNQNKLVLPPQLDQQQNPMAEPALHRIMVGQCEREHQMMASGWNVIQRIRDAVTPHMKGEPPNMADVAASVGTTQWGLRRSLAEQGTSYRAVLDIIRSELAQDYVRDTTLSFTDIADLLGFANPSAFHRAFQRWFGVTPGDYRKSTGEQEAHMSMPSSVSPSSSSS